MASSVVNPDFYKPVISVGKTTTGGLGWSDSMHNWYPAATDKPSFAVATGLTEL